jgi:hypothetical protein
MKSTVLSVQFDPEGGGDIYSSKHRNVFQLYGVMTKRPYSSYATYAMNSKV